MSERPSIDPVWDAPRQDARFDAVVERVESEVAVAPHG